MTKPVTRKPMTVLGARYDGDQFDGHTMTVCFGVCSVNAPALPVVALREAGSGVALDNPTNV